MYSVDCVNVVALCAQLDYCPSLPEFSAIYDGVDFYYIKDGKRFYISAQDAYLFISMEKEQQPSEVKP